MEKPSAKKGQRKGEEKERLTLSEDFWVEKSNTFVQARFTNYNLEALKLLDVYLSRINARDRSTRTVEFTKQELCALLGLHPKSKTKELLDAVNQLQKESVLYPESGTGENTVYVSAVLFPTATTYIDNKTGDMRFVLTCNDDAMHLFFDIDKTGYIRYLIRNVTKMRSIYSMKLYNRFTYQVFLQNTWECSVDELKAYLCISSDAYSNIRNLNRLLTQCCDEISQLTDLQVSYDTNTAGKKIVGYVFTIAKKEETEANGKLEDNTKAALMDTEKETADCVQDDEYTKKLKFMLEAVNNEFSLDEIAAIVSYMQDSFSDAKTEDANDLNMYDALHKMYLEAVAKPDINSRYAYIKKLAMQRYNDEKKWGHQF